MQRLLIYGATGRTGSLAVDYALSKNLQVVALVRSPQKLSSRTGLSVVPGSPENLDDIQRAIPGCTAVLSFLNNLRTSDFPWAGQVSPPNLMQHAITNTVSAMKQHDVRRIVVLSAAGVGDSAASTPWLWRKVVEHSNIRIAYADHDAQERVLRESGLDWTSVRAAALTGSQLQRTRISYDGVPKPGFSISRRTVATFMVDCLLHPEFYEKAPTASAD